MPKQLIHTTDAVVTEIRAILTITGLEFAIKYVEQEKDATGKVVRQDAEIQVPVRDDADFPPVDRLMVIDRLTKLTATWRSRRYT